MPNKHERTLIIIKPDAIQRNLLGEILHRFERKGLKIIGLKMTKLTEETLNDHYGHHKDQIFFPEVKEFMKSSPVVCMALEGYNAINASRLIVGPTKGYEAEAGSIRGDFSLSTMSNIVHASDSLEAGEIEIKRFFADDELFDYSKIDYPYLYSSSNERV